MSDVEEYIHFPNWNFSIFGSPCIIHQGFHVWHFWTKIKKIEKEDALIDLSAPAEENLRKIKAYAEKPNAYTFLNINGKQTRIIIKKAHIDNGLLVLDRIIPEGKREMSFEEFKRGHIKN